MMKLMLNNDEITEIVIEYLKNKGFNIIKDDINYMNGEGLEFMLSDETKPNISKCRLIEKDHIRPVCINLVNETWYNKVGGCKES